MSPFGFTPDDGSEENPNEMTPEQLAAMLAQMQEQRPLGPVTPAWRIYFSCQNKNLGKLQIFSLYG